MSGPSATAKPMPAKIAVISSMTWLIGWTRASRPALRVRQRNVDALGIESRFQCRGLPAFFWVALSGFPTSQLAPYVAYRSLAGTSGGDFLSLQKPIVIAPFLPNSFTRTLYIPRWFEHIGNVSLDNRRITLVDMLNIGRIRFDLDHFRYRGYPKLDRVFFCVQSWRLIPTQSGITAGRYRWAAAGLGSSRRPRRDDGSGD